MNAVVPEKGTRTGPVSAPSSLRVIRAGRLFDGRGGAVRERIAVVTEESRILHVCPEGELGINQTAAEVLDFPQGTLLPGLVDCHTHTNMPATGLSIDEVDTESDDIHLMQAVKNAGLALGSGVTTMRDNGGWRSVVFSLKEGIARGLVQGPRILAAGRPVAITGGHCWMMGTQADGVDGVRAAVRQLVHEGADFIKVMATGGSTRGTSWSVPSYTVEELRALVDEAHRHGRLVGAHALATQGIVNALDAGVDMIIHCIFVQPDGTARFEPRVAERIAESRVWVNPTLYIIPQGIRTRIRKLEQTEGDRPLSRLEKERLEADKALHDAVPHVIAELIAAGARVVSGSDCGWGSYPYGELYRELDALEKAGLSTIQALLSATRDAADALGLLDLLGTIERGKEADLLIVNGDPTRDLGALTSVAAVFKAGERVR